MKNKVELVSEGNVLKIKLVNGKTLEVISLFNIKDINKIKQDEYISFQLSGCKSVIDIPREDIVKISYIEDDLFWKLGFDVKERVGFIFDIIKKVFSKEEFNNYLSKKYFD